MGIGDFISDLTPDSVEDAIEGGVEWVGNRVEDAGNWTADRLDDAGWESGADWVREQSRSVANRMGAEVDELDLGQTEDKTRLIYGSPGKLDATAAKLRAFQAAFDTTGDGLKGLDSSRLKGEAADALRTAVSTQPPKWYTAADACAKALGALDAFAATVTWAQGQAQTAIDKWKEGTKASADAADAHRRKVDDYNRAVDRYNAQPADRRDPASLPAKPSAAFDDPGKKLMQDAQDLLAEARRQRNAAAETARTAVRAARDTAPRKPSYAEQVTDGLDEWQIMGDHVAGGLIKGTAGILNFARSVNPMDPYNLTHPAEYATSLNSLAAGLLVAANDPVGTGRQMIGDFMKDPTEGFGRLLPDVALTLATGGGGAAVKGVRIAEEASDLAKARRLLDDTPEGTHTRPDAERHTDGTDPVDLATGRMYLPQTDVELPGILPLAFTRRTESGCTAGRFLGPAWTSTVDERLEIDAVGVVHITADGLLIAYPHPAPGAPTTPDTGRSRTLLARDPDGDYTLTAPDSGLTFHFTAPPGSEPGGDGTAWLSAVTERGGHTITVERTENGLPLALVHSAGHRLNLTTTDGLVTALSLARAGEDLPLMSYGYQDGNLTTVTKPSGATTAFLYDDHDRVVTEGGEAGHVQITLTYTDPHPETGHRTTTLTTAAGHTTRHVFGPGCRLLSTTDPLGHTTRFTHDPRGNLRTRTDPLGHTTAFSYDEDGRAVSATRPDGSELRTVRGPFGLPVEVIAPDGTRVVHAYDEHGNRTAVTDQAGSTTHYTYDHAGRLTSLTDALGATTHVVCDAAGLPVEVTGPGGAVTRTERDALGRPVRITDPTGGVTRFAWHPDGHLARRTGPDGATESWTYDGEGNCLTHTDPSGGVSRFEYTHFDLPSARTRPDGARYEFEHDAELRLTRVTDPQGLAWTYTYDAAGNVVSETDFDGRTLTYRTDAAGQLTARTDALGGTVSFERDELGQVVRKNADGRTTTYVHDRAGRLLEAAGPDSELRYQYDRRGNVKTELVDGRPVSYAYDALGRRTRRTTPTGHVTSYTYGTDGRPQRLTTGTQTSATWPPHHPGSEATGPRTYTGTTLTRAGDVRLEHDALGRVTLRQKTRLSRKPDTWRYQWDTENRLTSVTTPDGTRWRYHYDPLGRRTAKQRLTADGEHVAEETRFTWDGLTLCEQTSHQPDTPNTIALTWDHRDVVPLAQTERILTADDRQDEIDRRFFAITTDLIGTPTELIDETGTIAWHTRTTLWGTTAWSRNSSTYTPLRFPGQYYDPETGLHYNHFRHYDPETARYTSPDPLGLAPAPNPLSYVDNPHSACDPLGLMPKYTKEERAQKRINKIVDDVVEKAQEGGFRKRHDYHGDTRHAFSDERVVEILKNPDAVYHSTGTSGAFTFRQGEDIVVIDGPGNTQGQAITAYGPSGTKGTSGASALGGNPTDPGAPVTHEAIVNGRIPNGDGTFQPPAIHIR